MLLCIAGSPEIVIVAISESDVQKDIDVEWRCYITGRFQSPFRDVD